MPEYTKNLKLYKADPVDDANDTFHIDKMLNDNWDAVDTASQQQLDALNSHKGDEALHVSQALKDSITASKDSLNTHIADQTKHVTQALKDQIGTTAQSLVSHVNSSVIHTTAAERSAAQAAAKLAGENKAAIQALQTEVAALRADLEHVMDAVFSNLTENSFAVRFDTLNDVVMKTGNWNKTENRVEC